MVSLTYQRTQTEPNVDDELSPFVGRLVRIGLPLVVLIFYVSAALEMGYTPDNAFFLLHAARDIVTGNVAGMTGQGIGSTSPLWVALLTVAGWGHLDLLLAAKVFSLLFACIAVILSYLIAYEVVVDRVIAFCAALAIAMQYWLLQAAPAGTPFACGLAFSLAGVFFLLRNQYLLSSICAGLLAMVFWQAAGFIVVIAVDALLNSTAKRRAVQVALASLLVFFAVLLPWMLFAMSHGLSVLCRLGSPGDLPEPSAAVGGVFLLLVLLALAGLVPAMRAARPAEREFARAHLPVFLWMAWLAAFRWFGGADLWFLLLPLLTVYAVSGLRVLVGALSRGWKYSAVFLLTALLLLVNQLTFNSRSKPSMARARNEAVELAMIATWLKGTLPDSARVEGEHPGLLGYYSRHHVEPFPAEKKSRAEFVVSSADSLPGFMQAFRPQRDSPRIESSRFAVWKRSP